MVKLNNNTLSLKDSIKFLNDSDTLNDLSDYVGKVTHMLHESIMEDSNTTKNDSEKTLYYKYGNFFRL